MLFPRRRFRRLCQMNDLMLDHATNRPGVGILREVFEQRRYATGFPFHRRATVLDVGAHFGYFALFAAQQLAENSRIVCVEPSSDNRRRLTQNLAANRVNATVVSVALSDRAGTVELNLAHAHNHSLTRPIDGGRDRTETVPTLTLPQLLDREQIPRVDFLKMDCEGSEYAILDATPSEVLDRIGVLSLEFHDTGRPDRTGNTLRDRFADLGWEVLEFRFFPTRQNLNYGSLVVQNPNHRRRT